MYVQEDLADSGASRPETTSMKRGAGSQPCRLQVAALALAIIVLGVREGGSSHGTPPPPLRPGTGSSWCAWSFPVVSEGDCRTARFAWRPSDRKSTRLNS